MKRPPTEAALLPQAVTVPCALNLEDDNRHDGRHHDRSGQYSHQRKHFLAGLLEAGRGKPFLHMRSCLRLPGLANELVAHNPRWCASGVFAQAFCLLRQTLIEWGVFFLNLRRCMALLHSWRRRERKPAFSSPIEATDRAVMEQSGMSGRRHTGQYSSPRESYSN